MALIIKGDMPTCCKKCDLRETVYGTHLWYRCFVDFHEVTQQVNDGTKSEDCPILGEIPDEHGRLVDADKLAQEFDGQGVFIEEEVKKIIDFFPVVVEASK